MLRRSAIEGPEEVCIVVGTGCAVDAGGGGCDDGLGGMEGAFWASKAGDCGPLLGGTLELVETTEAEPEDAIRLGCKSGAPLAYMNLLARGSGVVEQAGNRGEVGAWLAEGFGGALLPLA